MTIGVDAFQEPLYDLRIDQLLMQPKRNNPPVPIQ